MAIFASTTLGTSDPTRAMSIKALETRAQALAAAQARQETPTSMPSPWQGASHVFNQAADAFATRRADQAAAQQRQELAALQGQIGPEGPNPQQLAGITARDPDIGRMYAQQAFSARQNAADIAARKEAAAEAAKLHEAAAVAQEQRVRDRPSNQPIAEIDRAVARGEMSAADGEAAKKKLLAPPPAEQKLIGEEQDKNIDLQTTATELKEAAELLNQGVYSGGGAGLKGTIGPYTPDVLKGVTGTDPETTKRSQRYDQIMSSQVLQRLSTLKGPASNKDMAWAIETVNNPAASKENKQRALGILQAQMDAHLRASEGRLKTMGGTSVKVEMPPPVGAAAGAGAPAAAADPNAAARAWLAANPNDPRAEAVRKKLEGG